MSRSLVCKMFSVIISVLFVVSLVVMTAPFKAYADDNLTPVSGDMTINLNDSEYFGGQAPANGYYGTADGAKYVYAGGANTFYAAKVPYQGSKIGGYQVKSSAFQMLGIKVKEGASVTVYYAPGGKSRNIYMVDKLVPYAEWESKNVTVFESADDTQTVITHKFDKDTEVYFGADAPCYIAVIEVSYPSSGDETFHFALDGSDEGVTAEGEYSYVLGEVGNSINLNGGYCSIDSFPLTGDYTLTAWLKPNELGTEAALYKFGSDLSNYTGFFINNSSGQTMWIISSGGSSKTISFACPFIPGKWSHAAVVSKNNTVKIYIDGELMKTDTITISTSELLGGTENYIGKGSANFKGCIDEMRIFNYPLSDEQIKTFMTDEAQEIAGAEDIKMTVQAGERPWLPNDTNITYSNGMEGKAAVTWEIYETPTKDGTYIINGEVNAQGKTAEVKAEVTVVSCAIDKDTYSAAQTINLSNSAGVCRVNGSYKIFTDDNHELTGYMAVYDVDNRLIDCEMKSILPKSGEENVLDISLDLENSNNNDGKYAKMMLWKSDTQEPVSYPVKKEISKVPNGNYADTSNVVLDETNMFSDSEKIGLDYLLGVEVDRLLAPEYEVHKLTPPNNAKRYAGWETQTGNKTLAGHSLGHWMSAAAAMVRENGNEELLNRLNYAVDKLNELQEATGSGYIGGCGIETFNKAFAGVPNWTEGGYWVPWYGVHKIYQGLIDAYYYTDNPAALEAAKKFADWAVEGTSKLTYSQMQAMISVEYGGMNEVFAELYEITGDEKYLETARRFTQDSLLTPLSQGRDNLSGKHANTQIPKIIGAAKLYELDSEQYKDYGTACKNFWNYVVNDRSYAIGGNAIAEHFEELGAETLGIKTCESCNTYNMLRLTEHLFAWEHNREYMDYYETALYNHILGQQDPDTGSKEYFISMLPGHHRIYEEKYNSWWCCTGTGMENPARYTRNIYFEDGNDLYVNLYIPTVYTWEDKGITFRMETNYPYSEDVKFKVVSGEGDANIKFRIPSWCTNGFKVAAAGKTFTSESEYLSIDRRWSAGDEIDITVPMEITVYNQRAEGKIVYKYGPIVLAEQLESVVGVPGVKEYNSRERDLDSVAVDVSYIVTNGKELKDIVEPVDKDKLIFKMPASNSSDKKDIVLRPFYEIHHHFYNVYWDVDIESDVYEKALNKVTIDRVEPDGQQDEMAHNLIGTNSNQGSFASGTKTYFWRDAYGSEDASFSYNMNIDSSTKYLFVRYWGSDAAFTEAGKTYNRDFDIYVDDVKISSQQLNANNPDSVFDVFYQIPAELMSGKDNITIKFAPKDTGSCAGRVIEMRTASDEVKNN